jgi:preprotein translocase subunit YajC
MKEVKVSVAGTIIAFLVLIIVVGIFVFYGVISSKNDQIKELKAQYSTLKTNDSIITSKLNDSIEGYKIHIALKNKTINSQKLSIIHYKKQLKFLGDKLNKETVNYTELNNRLLDYDKAIYDLGVTIDYKDKKIDRQIEINNVQADQIIRCDSINLGLNKILNDIRSSR